MNSKIYALLLFFYFNIFNSYSQHYNARYVATHYNGFSDVRKAKWKRYFTGYAKPFTSATVVTHYVSDGFATSTPPLAPTDITKEIKLKSSKSFGVTAGAFYPLIRTGKQNAFGFDISAMGEVYQFNIDSTDYGPSLSLKDESFSQIISLPIAFTYKSGGEVNLDKRNKVLFSIGAGFAPSFALSKIIEVSSGYTTRRFAMIEFGVFTGIAWKIRATYFSKGMKLANITGGMLNYTTEVHAHGGIGSMDVSATGGSTFCLSLVILPFSWDWDKDGF